MSNDFLQFFEESIKNTDKLYCNYLGISKKDFPKWFGWKIISQYKEKGIDIKDIEDQRLFTLVKNFYYLIWIENKYF